MKKYYILLFFMALSGGIFAQGCPEIQQASLFQQYFESADFSKNDRLTLQSKASYDSLHPAERKSVLTYILLACRDRHLICVNNGYTTEIWHKESGLLTVLDTVNMNKLELTRFINSRDQPFNRHPWFFYWGGQATYTNEVLSMYMNTRIGTFLILDRLDVAASFGGGLTTSEGGDKSTLNIGIVSKYYHPLKIEGYSFSPYIGGGFSFYIASETSWDISGMIGVSWFIGPGSVDLGLQYGNVSKFMMSLGYTFSPWATK